MTSTRATALTAGLLFLVTHVTSVTALALYGPLLDDPEYVLGSGAPTGILWGAFLEGILALAVVGTAVTLYPVVKRQSEGFALGYVGLRVTEAAVIVVGIVPLLAILTLRDDGGAAGTEAGALVAVGQALVAVHNWTFLLGPSFVLGVSTVLLASLLHRSHLVPRFIPVLGLVGGPLVFLSASATLFGIYDQVSVWGAIAAVPVFAWELSLALSLVVKGFNPASPVQQEVPQAAATRPAAATN